MAGNQERPRMNQEELAYLLGRLTPGPARQVVLGQTLRGLAASLCLHRVAPKARATDWQQGLSIAPAQLDELIETLLSSRPGPANGWLSVTFDDGYRDAGDYISTRAARFPHVNFLFFICPEKTEKRVGFRWDLVEESIKEGQPRDAALSLLSAPTQVEHENLRAELRSLASREDYALCTLEELKALQALPNVQLGNHTNLHLSSNNAPDDVIKADFERSTAQFERLFGPQKHFAFPFGTPRYHFAERHVAWLRSMSQAVIWTTEPRPYRFDEEKPQAVLPRFPIDGSQDSASLLGLIIARSLQYRFKGPRNLFPLP